MQKTIYPRKGDLDGYFRLRKSEKNCGKNVPPRTKKPVDIVSMDWLADNVIGTISGKNAFIPSVGTMIDLQGIHKPLDETPIPPTVTK